MLLNVTGSDFENLTGSGMMSLADGNGEQAAALGAAIASVMSGTPVFQVKPHREMKEEAIAEERLVVTAVTGIMDGVTETQTSSF
jgi:hypothetical protein